jgi:hypothetical protein
MQIWVAGVDDKLTNEGLIWPGLGDTVCGAECFKPDALTLVYRVIACSTHSLCIHSEFP